MSYRDRYHDWLTWVDDETKQELLSLTDEREIEERFYKELEFGTGGLRGIMGVGSNRINKYTIRKATKGLANYLWKEKKADVERGVVIAYDSRNHSAAFALEAAHVLCSANIPVRLFRELEPTPVLSFAVKYLHAIAGIVITASHNPKEYNGYKVYDEYGDQIVPHIAATLIQYVNAVTNLADIPADGNDVLLHYIGDTIVDAFIQAVYTQAIFPQKPKSLKIVYTPLHGAGNKPVRKILQKDKFTDIHIVTEQEQPDGNFSTVISPNPEESSALAMGIQLAKKIEADIVIGTDPDSDRIGVGVRDGEHIKLLTGNQIGALLVNFILSMRQSILTPASTVVKTVVTGELGANIARAKGVQVVETLTGFKYIGEKITQYQGDSRHEFIMGYEESYGYLIGIHAQDKDAVVAALLICEMADYYKSRGRNLIEVLQSLYRTYGYYFDALCSYTLEGLRGLEHIRMIMQYLRKSDGSKLFPDMKEKLDYQSGIDGLPSTNMIKFILQDGSWIAIRPSGTEPKIKIYFSLHSVNKEMAETRMKQYKIMLEKEVHLA